MKHLLLFEEHREEKPLFDEAATLISEEKDRLNDIILEIIEEGKKWGFDDIQSHWADMSREGDNVVFKLVGYTDFYDPPKNEGEISKDQAYQNSEEIIKFAKENLRVGVKKTEYREKEGKMRPKWLRVSFIFYFSSPVAKFVTDWYHNNRGKIGGKKFGF